MTPKDVVIHSHIADGLPDNHKDAYTALFCCVCSAMLHASNNECMQTWVETGKGPFCISCFSKIEDVSALDDDYGITEGTLNPP